MSRVSLRQEKNLQRDHILVAKDFLQVFEELQKKRRLRQEKKLLRRQQNLGSEDAAEMARDERVSKSRSSYDSKMPLETGSYSVLLEGSKGHGAAVGLTLNKSKSRQGHNPTSNRTGRGFEQPSRNSDRDLNANFYSRSEHGPLMAVNAEIHPHRPTSQTHQRVPHQRSIPDGRNTYIYSGGIQAIPTNHAAQQRSTPKTTHVAQKQKQSSGNYTKLSSHSSNTNIKDRPSQSQSSVHDESDFLFIDLLQEEFADERHKGGFPVRSGRKGGVIGPPNQNLRSEDIERRIREWLSARQDTDDNISVFADDETTVNGGDTASRTSSDSYF